MEKKNTRQYSVPKKVLSTFLAFVMILTAVAVGIIPLENIAPTADAAVLTSQTAGGYELKVFFNISYNNTHAVDKSKGGFGLANPDDVNDGFIIATRTYHDNGRGTTAYDGWNFWSTTNGTVYEEPRYTTNLEDGSRLDAPVGFPIGIYVCANDNQVAGNGVKATISKVEINGIPVWEGESVLDSTNLWKTLYIYNDENSPQYAVASEKNFLGIGDPPTYKETRRNWPMPSPTVTFNGADTVTTSGSTKGDYSIATAVDQYNVNWGFSSVTWASSDTTNVSISTNNSVATATFGNNNSTYGANHGLDYTVTFTPTLVHSSGNRTPNAKTVNVKTTHTLNYDLNGGTLGTTTATGTTGSVVNLPTPTRPGYTFTGWTRTGGSGTVGGSTTNGVSSQTYTFANEREATVRANWSAVTYNVVYDKNTTDTVTNMPNPASTTKTYGTNLTLSSNVPARTGYTFGGWDVYVGNTYQNANVAAGGTLGYDYVSTQGATVTLKAKWVGVPYDVYLDKNADDAAPGTDKVTATFGSDMPTDGVTMPTRPGYTFAGYYDNANSGGTQYYTANGASAHVWDKASTATLYARWTANDYTITYDADGGTISSNSQTYKTTDTATLRTPTKTGYTFGGWQPTADSGNWKASEVYPASTSVKDKYGNVTLKAIWTPIKYNVTLNPQGGTGGTSNVEVTYNADMPEIEIPTRVGYTFAGYYDTEAATGGTMYYNANGTSAHVWNHTTVNTLYARWTPDTYTIRYDGNKPANTNGSVTGVPGSQQKTYGTSINLTTDKPSLEGYTFAGWATNPDGSGTTYASGAALSNDTLYPGKGGTVTLYAQWTANTYTVHFNGTNSTGGSMNDQTFTYDTPDKLNPNAFSRRYTVTYHENYGDDNTLSATSIYHIDGWARTENGSKEFEDGAEVLNLAASDTVNLYIIWKDGGLTLPNYTRANYALEGWYTDAALTNKVGEPGDTYYPEADTELYANWVQHQYNIVYDKNGATGGSVPETQTKINYDATVALRENTGNLERTGYTLSGWNTSADGKGTHYDFGQEVSSLTLEDSITLYAEWTPNTYEVTFISNHANDGTGSFVTVSVTYGEPWPTPPTLDRVGSTLIGWYSEAEAGTRYYDANGKADNAAYLTAGNTEVYAHWKALTYNIRYVANASGVENMPTPNPVVKSYGTEITLAAAPSKTGYTFRGWATNANGSDIVYAAGVPFNADPADINEGATVNLYAIWDAVTYTVEYDGNAPADATEAVANVPASQTKTFGADLTLSGTTPSLPGYEFSGWEIYVDGEDTNDMIEPGDVLDTDYVNTQDATVTLKAVWTNIEYQVTYNANGGRFTDNTERKTLSASYGEKYPNVEEPSRTGYEFAGWFTSAGVQVAPGESIYYPPTGTTIFARWTVNESTVTVKANGGNWNGSAADKQFTGAYNTYTEIPVPTREGYTFTGWALSSGANGSIYDNTYVFGSEKDTNDILTAQWEINKLDVTLITGEGYEVVENTESPVEYGDSYSVTIKLSDGYTDSDAPSVNVSSGSVTVIDNNDGTFTYTIESVTENTTIEIGDAQKNTYNVTVTTADNAQGIEGYTPAGAVTVEHGTGTTTITVTLDSAYSNSDAPVITYDKSKASLSGGVKSVVNGKTVYTYTVYNVTDDTEFAIGSASANSYIVTLNDTRVGYTVVSMPDSPVIYNGTSSVTIELNDAYSGSEIPAYSVQIGNATYTGEPYITVSRDGNRITYTVNNITDNAQINIGDATINTYFVTLNASEVGYSVTTYPASTVNHGNSVTFTVTLDEAYSNSRVPAITATNATARGYKNGNVITYVVTDISGNCDITVGDAEINTYSVTVYPGAGVDMFDADGNEIYNGQQFAVAHGDNFSFTLGNTGSFIPKVYANGVAVAPDANGVYTVNVTDNVVITTDDVKYTVIFVDWDNSILASFIISGGDNAPIDEVATPTRENTDHHYYSFIGWLCTSPKGDYNIGDKLEDVTENRVFQAQYDVEHHNLPTDSNEKEHWHYCPECGYEEGRAAHKEGGVVYENVILATCSTLGSRDEVVYCTECERELSRKNVTLPLDPNNHSTDKTYSKVLWESNCTEHGLKVYFCVDCNNEVRREELSLAAGAHVWGAWVHNEDNQTHTRTCVLCGEEQTKYHNLREIYRSAATCTNDGSIVSLCPDCATVVTQHPAATEKHIAGDPVWDNYDPATCVRPGRYDLARHCIMCGEVVESTEVIIPATGIHNYKFIYYTVNDAIIDYEDFECGFEVVAHYECTYCGHPKTEEFTVEHDYEWAITVDPTETENGVETGTCVRCGATVTRELVFEPTGERAIQFIAQNGVTFQIPYEMNAEGRWIANAASPTTVKGSIMFYTNVDLKFFVYINNAFLYTDYDVYIDGVKAAQNPDGSFSVKASASNSSIQVVGTTPAVIDPGDSGSNTGDANGKISFWQRILNFFRSIGDFFRNLFS